MSEAVTFLDHHVQPPFVAHLVEDIQCLIMLRGSEAPALQEKKLQPPEVKGHGSI